MHGVDFISSDDEFDLVRIQTGLNDGLDFVMRFASERNAIPLHDLISLSDFAQSVNHSSGKNLCHKGTHHAISVGDGLPPDDPHSESIS